MLVDVGGRVRMSLLYRHILGGRRPYGGQGISQLREYPL